MTIPISGTPHPASIDYGWEDLSSIGSQKNQELRKPPSPQHQGFCGWLSRVVTYLSGTFGEKLGCTQLNTALTSIFTPSEGWEPKSTFEYGGSVQVGCRSKELGGVTYVVGAPAHDLLEHDTMQALLSGGRSAGLALNEIKNLYPNGEVKALIPIAQSNSLGYFGTRGHFVLLEVTMTDGQIKKAKIHDSKGGLLDTFYDGASHLTKQLRAEKSLGLGDNFKVTTEHHGEQSLFNGNDCGRYAAYYAATIIEKGDLSETHAGAAKAFFKKHF